MTREEIINEINCLLSELDNGEDAVSYLTRNDVNWLNENIKALEQEPCEDAVSRTEVLNLVRFNAFHVKSQIKAIENMPSVTPQEPILDKIRAEIKKSSHGKWYVGRIDGKTEEVLLLDEVMQILDKYKAESEG